MRSDRLRLEDILAACAEIQASLPATQADFDSNRFLQSHIYRFLTIIGEATFKASDALKQANPQVPWNRIQGMRHILVHDYFKVNWGLVYEVARDFVPVLRPQVEAILASLPPDPSAP